MALTREEAEAVIARLEIYPAGVSETFIVGRSVGSAFKAAALIEEDPTLEEYG